MNRTVMNKQNTAISKQYPGICNNSSKHPQNNHSNIIPFPTQPVPGKQPATGARHLGQLIRYCLHRVRKQLRNHITSLPSNGQRNGKCDESAIASKRAIG